MSRVRVDFSGFNEAALRRASRPGIERWVSDLQRQLDRTYANHRGKSPEEIVPHLRELFDQASVSELHEYAQCISEGVRIKLKPEIE